MLPSQLEAVVLQRRSHFLQGLWLAIHDQLDVVAFQSDRLGRQIDDQQLGRKEPAALRTTRINMPQVRRLQNENRPLRLRIGGHFTRILRPLAIEFQFEAGHAVSQPFHFIRRRLGWNRCLLRPPARDGRQTNQHRNPSRTHHDQCST